MARIDTLPHFLTDVADAIRAKKGTVAPISIADFDTEIASISGGSSNPVEPKSVVQMNTTINAAISYLSQYMAGLPSTYATDTTEATTLYKPHNDCSYYIIQKRASGKYRVDWTDGPILYLDGTNIYNFRWALDTAHNSGRNQTLDTTVINVVPTTTSAGQAFYYSEEYDTIAECITKMKNNELTYTQSTRYLAYSVDTPLTIPYSNACFIDASQSSKPIIPSKRISSNETIILMS